MALRMTPDQAATVALKGLAYLANFEPELTRFMELTGTDREAIRERADEPEFLVAILDFMLANEAVLVDFCDDTSVDARMVHMARHVLSGR
jgi:Protein of unknown function (DUF3572)